MNKERQLIFRNFDGGLPIPVGADLNDYAGVTGWYHYDHNPVAGSPSLKNCPVPSGGFLLCNVVWGTGRKGGSGTDRDNPTYIPRRTQLVIAQSDSYGVYVRNQIGNEWRDWLPLSEHQMGIGINSSTDLNDLQTPGVYAATSSGSLPTNIPPSGVTSAFRLDVVQITASDRLEQILTPTNSADAGGVFFKRSLRKYSGTVGWSSWYKFTGTAVT